MRATFGIHVVSCHALAGCGWQLAFKCSCRVCHALASCGWQLASELGPSAALPGAQVIDAEMARRKMLEESPIPSTNEEPVFFDTAEIPWWAWVRRFHLPEVRPALTLPYPYPKLAGCSASTCPRCAPPLPYSTS